MAVKAIYCPDPVIDAGVLTVTGEEHTHLRVSRTGIGEPVEAFDGAGGVWEGAVVSARRNSTRIGITSQRREPPPPFEIILAPALIKPRPFEWMLEKAVEIGVTRIVPFRAGRSRVETDRKNRWRRIIVEAAKQSRHYHLPRLDPVSSIDTIFQIEAQSKILFALQSSGSLESAIQGAPVLYMIGPEGGWNPEELEGAREAGFHGVRLGGHIMRAETASVVAGGLIAYQLGVFRN